jgi:hypothetical protein
MNILINTLIMLATGIPGIVVAGLAMILMMLGLIRKETSLMAIAAVLTIPVAYAMGSWSGLLLFVRLLPLFPALSAVAIDQDEPLFAWVLPLPAFVYLVYLVFNLVVSDFRG